jgi:L-amino acid N-acyltransferase YncA
MTVDKAHENRVRRAAERQGFRLSKARVRDPLAISYGWHIRQGRRKVAHFRDFEDAERWITDPASRDGGSDV